MWICPCALGQTTHILWLFVDDGSVEAGGLGVESQNKLQKEHKERREGSNTNVNMVSNQDLGSSMQYLPLCQVGFLNAKRFV